MFCEKGFLKNFAKFTENTYANVSFSIKLQDLDCKKETLALVFPVNFVKLLRSPFFIEYLRWLLLIHAYITNQLERNTN